MILDAVDPVVIRTLGTIKGGNLAALRVAVAASLTVFVLIAQVARVQAQTATVDAYTGQTCAGTRFGSDLKCTSNDFSSGLSFDQEAATKLENCVAGETVTLNIIATITSNSPTRYDGAYFISENGIDPSLYSPTSSCSIGVFPTSPVPFLDLDSDSCGDYTAGAQSTLLMRNVQVLCQPSAGTSQLNIPYTLVFNNQPGTTACTPANVTANTTAKCLSSGTTSVTGVTVNGFVRVTKQTLPDGEPGSFAFSAIANAGTAPTPTSFTLADGQQQIVRVPFGAGGTGRTLTITEAALGGWDPTASITCTTPSGGSASAYVTVNNATRTITAQLTTSNYGANCTITNTHTPTLQLQKTTLGGPYGPFSFTDNNLVGTLPNITTLAADTPTPDAPVALPVSPLNAAVTIAEPSNADYFLSGFSCTDSNATRTGNTGALGSFSGTTGTVPASAVVPGAVLHCVMTNTLANPAVSVSKVASPTSVTDAGNVVTYTITVTNTGNVLIPSLTVSDPLGSANCGSGTPTITNLAVGAMQQCTVSYTVTQADFDNYGDGDGDIDNTVTVTGTLGSHSISQTASTAVTLVLDRRLAVVKKANKTGPLSVNEVVTYTFEVTNPGNVTLTDVHLQDVTNATGTAPVPGNEQILRDVEPLDDSDDAAANGSWDVLAPGDTIVFEATYTVLQSDIDQLQ